MMKEIAYFNGEFLEKSEIRISPDDRGFLFADSVYEAIAVYSGKLFRFKEHFERLQRSLNALKINEPQELNTLEEISKKLISENKLQDCNSVIYLQITRGAYPRMHRFSPETVRPTIYMFAKQAQIPPEFKEGAQAVTINDFRWGWCDIKSTALTANVQANQYAYEQNVYEAIFIKNGVITEATHSNVFGVIDNKIVTHPKSNAILHGITREVVMEICHEKGLLVVEEPFYELQIPHLQELFITCTTCEVLPIIAINHKPIANGKIGEITKKLMAEFEIYKRKFISSS